MNTALRKEVLTCFKNLHKARKEVFSGDVFALNEGRKKINEEFRKNSHVSDDSAISELIQLGIAVEIELKTTVIQAREVKPGVYEAKINPGTITLDNTPYNDLHEVKIKS